LAAGFLARRDAENLLIVGAGRLSLNLIQAHSSVRSISSTDIWARRIDQAARVARTAQAMGFNAQPVEDLEAAVRDADIVSTCTLSQSPLVRGAWLRPGTHLDLVGAYKADMRESDDEAVRCSTLFVDTRGGAMTEGGDIIQPLRSGLISEADIAADLYDLCRGTHVGRKSEDEITLFKSVGAAIEDLAAARLAYEG
jgi:ornithine cyclodeaminase